VETRRNIVSLNELIIGFKSTDQQHSPWIYCSNTYCELTMEVWWE